MMYYFIVLHAPLIVTVSVWLDIVLCVLMRCSNCYGKCYTDLVEQNTQLSFNICLACIFKNNNKDQLIELFSESIKNDIIALLIH